MKTDIRQIIPVLTFVFLMVSGPFAGQGRQAIPPEGGRVRIIILHVAGGGPLIFDTILYTNNFGNPYSVSTLQYFISGITLRHAIDGDLPLPGIHFIDATLWKTTSFQPESPIPPGRYDGIRIVIGLDSTENISGRFLNPPENRMEWPETMGGGYHYMKLEGKFEAGDETGNYQAHTGQLNGTPNIIRIDLPFSPVDVDEKGFTILLRMNVDEWWMNPNILDLNDISAIMDNPGIQRKLMENGKDVFTVELQH